jgi:MFS family permease
VKIGDMAGAPIRYLQQIPATIRLLSLGILVNRMGGYVTVFLTLILVTRQISAVKIGVALTLAGIFAILGNAIGGASATRLGERRTMIASTLGSAFFTGLLIFFNSFTIMVGLICAISLLNRAYLPPAAVVVGRVSPPGERVKMYAFFQFSFNIGAAIGPLIATYLLTRSLAALFAIDASTSCLFAIAALRLPRDAPRPADNTSSAATTGQKPLRRDYRYLMFCISVALAGIAYAQSSGALPLGFRSHHDSPQLLGLLLSANAIAIILFQLPLTNLTRRPPPWLPLAAGGFLICAGFALLLAGFSVPLLVISTGLWTLGEMLGTPLRPVVAMVMSSDASHAAYQGALGMARTAGGVIGPAVGAFAYSASPSLPWIGCAVLAIPVTVLPFLFLRGVGVTAPAGEPSRV